MSTDTLSEVLRAVRLTGAVFFNVDARSPWVAEAAPARELGPHIMPGVEHVIEYHVITGGSCWAGIVGEPPVRLEKGDIVVFPQGDAHVLSSAPGMRGESDLEVYKPRDQLPVKLNLGGGGKDQTTAICGFLGCDVRPFNPLLATLPRVIVVRATGSGGLREQLVQLALTESLQRRAGSECALARLSELLFIEVVRDYVAQLPTESVGWLGGLRDDVVGRALKFLHDRPAHPWTLEELASEVGASRSVLAERFAQFAGAPPMQYLAQWRMQLAARELSQTASSIAEVAQRVGYGSEAAFSRAFKRLVGVAPTLWRQGQRAA